MNNLLFKATALGARGPVVKPQGLVLAALAACVGLLGLAGANVLLSRRTERRHPPQGRFVELDGVRLHYLERGSGPAILLIHGNVVSGDDFAISGLVDRLAHDHRVIAFDRPGFGHSTRPRGRAWTTKRQGELLYKALQHLGVQRPVVVGHSLGSLVAMNIALHHQEDVAGLVLMSGYYLPTLRPDIPLAGATAIPILGDLLRFTVSPLFGRLTMRLVIKMMFAPAKVTRRFRRGFGSSMALRPLSLHAIGADSLNMAPDAAKTEGGRRTLEQIPVLILGGRDDRIVSFDHQSARLARELPHAKLQVVEGAGHMIHHSAPDEVADAIRLIRET